MDPSFERALGLQASGDLAGAAAAYRQVHDLPAALAVAGQDGQLVRGPDFLLIGAPRTGTTWLVRQLSRHPDIFVPEGEPHYLLNHDRGSPRDYVAGFAEGASFKGKPDLLPGTGPGTARLFGDKSPGSIAMSDQQIALCAALFPKLKIVCGVRDPVRRAWSHIVQKKYAPEDYTPVGGFIPKRLRKILLYGCYAEHLARWARHYPPEQIMLIDFARQTWRPRAVYREVLAHIGARPYPRRDLYARNPDRTAPPAEVAGLLEDHYAGQRWDLPYLNWIIRETHGAARGLSPTPPPPVPRPSPWSMMRVWVDVRRVVNRKRKRLLQRLRAV